MDRIDVSTVVYCPPREVYEFLLDFPRYARYSKHLDEVTQHGDGGPGTEYDLRFTWWKVGYTVHSRVTDVDPPNRIDWEIVEDIDARGAWIVEEIPDQIPENRDAETATRIRFRVEFDPDSADPGSVNLPSLVSLDWVIDRVTPRVLPEAERVVERAVRDLEGQARRVDLTVERTSGAAD